MQDPIGWAQTVDCETTETANTKPWQPAALSTNRSVSSTSITSKDSSLFFPYGSRIAPVGVDIMPKAQRN